MLKKIATAVAGMLLLGLASCTTSLGYKAEYVASGVSAPVVQGRAVVIMDDVARGQTFSGGPQSMTGGATSITVPLGQYIEKISEKVCAPYFSQGAAVGKAPEAGAYALVVESQGFSYKYDQLSSLGFAVTPKVTVALKVGINGPKGEVIAPPRRYERTDFSATGGYVFSANPPEKINQSAHMAIADILREAMGQLPRSMPGQ